MTLTYVNYIGIHFLAPLPPFSFGHLTPGHGSYGLGSKMTVWLPPPLTFDVTDADPGP